MGMHQVKILPRLDDGEALGEYLAIAVQRRTHHGEILPLSTSGERIAGEILSLSISGECVTKKYSHR